MGPLLLTLQLVLTGGSEPQPQDAGRDASAPAQKVVTIGRTDTPPKIDGQIDDAAWSGAVRITEFVQQRPLEGAPATEQTEVIDRLRRAAAVLRHLRALHRPLDRPRQPCRPRPDRPRRRRLDLLRPVSRSAARVHVFGERVTASRPMRWRRAPAAGVAVAVGALEVEVGAAVAGRPAAIRGRLSPARRTRTARGTRCSTAPATSSRTDGSPSWRSPSRACDIRRVSAARPIVGASRSSATSKARTRASCGPRFPSASWAFSRRWAPSRAGGSCRRAGTWSSCQRSRPFTLAPSTHPAVDTSTSTARPQAGLNVKYGVTSNLISDFTVNPDFSQIESDAAQIEVNQRFPLFYSERRPFFLEGQEIFNIPAPVTMIHTRTIVDPGVRRQADREGRPDLTRRSRGERRSAGQGGSRRARVRQSRHRSFLGRVRYDLYSRVVRGRGADRP